MNANTIRTITIRSKLEGGRETSDGLKDIRVGHERLVSALEKSAESHVTMAEAFAKVQRSFDMAARSQQEFVRVQQQMRAANDNASSSFRISGAEAASLANHLKNVALAAYALSPAFRGLVNPLIPAALHAIGPAAVTAGKMVFAALTPLISFLARVALPIYAAAKAIQYLVNSVAEGVRDFQAFQAQQVALQNTLNATAGASGKSAAEINKLADGMGDIGKSREAAKALLEFQGVAGPTFDRALKAANDLAAAGMGNVVSAARAMGKALEDPANGMDAFAAAGVRFTTQQKHLIKELVETGDRAGAVNTILGIVEGKVGGSAAAATNTLEGAYKQLNDALQRGSEQFGKTIVEATSLVSIIQTLANAVNALNNIDISGFVSRFKTIRGISAILGFFSSEKPTDASTVKGSSSADAQRKADAAAAQLQRDAIDKVTISIQKEIDALKQSELQKQIDTNLRMAGVAATSEAGRAIAASTTQLFNEKKAIEDANEARRKAEATAARHGEQLRRMDADQTNRLAQLQLERQSIGLSEEAALALRLREEELGKLRRQNIAESPQLVASIDQWAKAYAKLSIENERFRDALRQVKDISGTAIASFIRDLSQGVDMMDALRSAARALGDTLIDIGTKKLVSMAVDQAASMFGAGGSDPSQAGIAGGTALATGGQAAGTAMIAGATKAAEILGLSGATTGTKVAVGGAEGGAGLEAGGLAAGLAINGPLIAFMAAIVAVGALLNMWSSSSSKAKQEEEAQARAWEAWEAAGQQLATYTAKMTGSSVGTISTRLRDASGEAERLTELRAKAMNLVTAEQKAADPIIKQIRDDFGKFSKRIIQEFERTFPDLIAAMNSGLGPDSPFFQALQQMRDLGEKAKEFIADAEFVWGKGSGQADQARKASQEFLLAQLNPMQDMSAAEKAMAELNGKAKALQEVLVSLGMSAEEAARRIDEGVKKSIDALKKSFTEDLQRQINDLEGKGFLNDAFDAIKKNADLLKDDKALGGGNKDLIDKLFGLSVQDIVNKFQLTGDAFKEFMKQFPELIDKIKQFDDVVGKLALQDRIFNAGNDTSTAAGKRAAFERDAERQMLEAAKKGADYRMLLERAIGEERKRLEREIVEESNNRRRSLEDQLFNAGNDSSTLEGKLAAHERDAARRRLEEIKAGGEHILLLEKLLGFERQKLIDDFVKAALEAEQKRIQTFRDRLFAATNDTTTLEGQLAAFDRQAQREREEEFKAGNGAIAELEIAFAAERLNIIRNFSERALEETKRAAEAELQARNQAVRPIAEYLANLVAGPNSTLSAQDRFANAQTQYNATLTLAQGGNVDALQRITQEAENMRTAARDLYGSAAPYQAILQQIMTQLTALPAIQESDDPIVVAIRDSITAINAANAIAAINAMSGANVTATGNTTTAVGGTTAAVGGTTAAVGGTTGAVNTANVTLNAQKAALDLQTALLTTLNNLTDAVRLLIQALNNFVGGGSTDSLKNLISVTNAKVDATNAKVDATTAMVGLVRADTFLLQNNRFVDTNFNIAEVARQVADVKTLVGPLEVRLINLQNSVNSVNAAIGAGVGGNSLQSLNSTANSTLELLRQQLSVTSQTFRVGTDQTFGAGVDVTLSNASSVIAVLGIIAFNTYAIAINTKKLVAGGQGPIGYAKGGVIPPFGLGLVSEHLNPTLLRAGPEPITVSPFSPANDNGQWSAVLAELRSVKAELASLRKETGVNLMRNAQHVREGVDENTEAVREDSNTQATEKRQDRRSRKVA